MFFHILLILLTLYSFVIHASAGEMSPLEIALIELAWVPLLATSKCRDKLYIWFAGYSAYYLPRLIELHPGLFTMLVRPEVAFYNWMLRLVGAEIALLGGWPVVLGPIRARLVVGCTSLRQAPLLLAVAAFAGARALLAALALSILVIPLNGARLLLIVAAAKYLGDLSHVIISPVYTVVSTTLLLYLLDLASPGVIKKLEDGMDCFLSELVRGLRGAFLLG